MLATKVRPPAPDVRPSRRSDGRAHDTGLQRPYRPCPPDFRDRFLEMGQSKELDEHYHTNWRCVRRWIEESGGDELRAERRAISKKPAQPRLRSPLARNYVLGKRLSSPRKGE